MLGLTWASASLARAYNSPYQYHHRPLSRFVKQFSFPEPDDSTPLLRHQGQPKVSCYGPLHFPHAAFADLGADLVLPEAGADVHRHGDGTSASSIRSGYGPGSEPSVVNLIR